MYNTNRENPKNSAQKLYTSGFMNMLEIASPTKKCPKIVSDFETGRVKKIDFEDSQVINYYRKMNYRHFLRTVYWSRVKEKIKEVYGKRCSKCGLESKKVEIHHLNYSIRGKEILSGSEKYLVPICIDCHRLEHKSEWKQQKVERVKLRKFFERQEATESF